MAKILTKQSDVDKVFNKMEKNYGAYNNKQQAYAVREMSRIRGETAELLADYSDKKGVIKKKRLSGLLGEMDIIEDSLRVNGMASLDTIIVGTSGYTLDTINKGIGIDVSKAQFDKVNKDVVKYTINRFGDDGLVLSDRVWGLSGEIRDNLSTVIRTGIIRGDGINSMIPKIRDVYDNESWKIRRLARNESVTAHRAAISYNARESDVVKWLEFHAGDDNSKACVSLASEDRYGKGSGVFKPSDTDLFNPHVNCTGYSTYVLDERWL